MTYISEILRRIVHSRSQGRCEYCHLHERNTLFHHQVDHIIAEKHGGKTIEQNLCAACAECNRYKGSDLCSYDAITDSIVTLFNPRNDVWDDHFTFDDNGYIQPLSGKGRVTESLLRFNDLELVAERKRLIVSDEW
jgi:vacuolar-type H+-ATPase subunit I/STV1